MNQNMLINDELDGTHGTNIHTYIYIHMMHIKEHDFKTSTTNWILVLQDDGGLGDKDGFLPKSSMYEYGLSTGAKHFLHQPYFVG